MEIISFDSATIEPAAALYAASFRRLRRDLPILPARMEDPACVAGNLNWLMNQCPGVAAVQEGRLVGYMGWLLADNFRGAPRKGAYVPDWGHGVAEGSQVDIVYRAMYRAAAAHWLAQGVQVHAITLLADDKAALDVWFWNGFGLTVVDAIRPTAQPLRAGGFQSAPGCTIRQATLADVHALADLEAEHWRHYAEPPTLMMANAADDADDFTQFLSMEPNSAWLAFVGSELAGYVRFEGQQEGELAMMRGDHGVAITGAYVRPVYRGRGLTPAILDAALQDYAAHGFDYCGVNFESFNPEAAAFWPRYFKPAAYSLLRVPERA